MFNLWCLKIFTWVIIMKFYCITLETGFLCKFSVNLVSVCLRFCFIICPSSYALCFHNTHNELVLKVAGSYEVSVFILLLLAISRCFIIGSALECNALSRFLSLWDKMREQGFLLYVHWVDQSCPWLCIPCYNISIYLFIHSVPCFCLLLLKHCNNDNILSVDNFLLMHFLWKTSLLWNISFVSTLFDYIFPDFFPAASSFTFK